MPSSILLPLACEVKVMELLMKQGIMTKFIKHCCAGLFLSPACVIYSWTANVQHDVIIVEKMLALISIKRRILLTITTKAPCELEEEFLSKSNIKVSSGLSNHKS